MAIDEIPSGIDSAEGLGASVESGNLEVSEKYKESSKKSAQGIQRTQKDEKKVKKYDFVLAGFLVKILLDKRYDFILVQLFKSMDYGYTSNFILGIISLINTDISNAIREYTGKSVISFKYKNEEQKDFDSDLPAEVKSRINFWIEDIIDSVTINYSSVITGRIIELLDNDKEIIYKYITDVLVFFLKSINIKINTNEAKGISEFIISETYKKLKKLEIQEI